MSKNRKPSRPIQVESRIVKADTPNSLLASGMSWDKTFSMLEKEQQQLQARETMQRIDDAGKSDAELDQLPLSAPFGITALIRHAALRTGFTYEELGVIAGADPGVFTQLAAGARDVGDRFGSYYGGALIDFVNISRRVEATLPHADLRDWWEQRAPYKRFSPLELIIAGRQWDKIFDSYREPLVTNPPSHVLCTGVGMIEVDFFYPYQ